MVNCQRPVPKNMLHVPPDPAVTFTFPTNVDPLLMGLGVSVCVYICDCLRVCVCLSCLTIGLHLTVKNWNHFSETAKSYASLPLPLSITLPFIYLSPLCLPPFRLVSHLLYRFDLITNNLTTNCRTFKYDARISYYVLRHFAIWYYVISQIVPNKMLLYYR